MGKRKLRNNNKKNNDGNNGSSKKKKKIVNLDIISDNNIVNYIFRDGIYIY